MTHNVNRRQFFKFLYAALITAPLVAAGLMKAPAPKKIGCTLRRFRMPQRFIVNTGGLFNPKADLASQYKSGQMLTL